MSSSRDEVDFHLTRGLTLGGRFRVQFPVERIDVTCDPDPGVQHIFGASDLGSGAFRFEHLRPGRYELTVVVRPKGRDSDSITRTFEVSIDDDVTDYERTILPDGGRLSLKVFGAQGGAVAWNGGRSDVPGVLTLRGKGGGFEKRLVQVNTTRSQGTHCTWMADVSNYMGWGLRKEESFTLDLPDGEWSLSLELEGYEPWLSRVHMAGNREVLAPLELRPGRVVSVDVLKDIDSVGIDARALPNGHWRVLSARSRDFLPPMSWGPPSVWIPEGIYDIRVSVPGFVEQVHEEVQIEASNEPLVFSKPTSRGMTIRGRFDSNMKARSRTRLYLFRLEGTSWRHLSAKDTAVSLLELGRKGGGTQEHFAFTGLESGTYRVTLDKDGAIEVGRWTLTDHDLEDEVIDHTFR